MIVEFCSFCERKLNDWFSELLICIVLVETVRLTGWAAKFAEAALASKADLMGTAGIITAVAGIPVAIGTLLFNKYAELRKADKL